MRAWALVLACLAAGCARDEQGAALVDGLRLLGVQAEPPEAAPGQTVQLTAWAVDPRGGEVTIEWNACFLHDRSLVDPRCFKPGAGVEPLGEGATLSMVMPEVQRQDLAAPDATDGVYLPIVLHLRSGGETLDGVYRLRLSNGERAPNQNPVLLGIEGLSQYPDSQLEVRRGTEWTIRAFYSELSKEPYFTPPVRPGDEPQHHYEFLTTQWFATGCVFSTPITGGAAYTSFKVEDPLPPPGGIIDLWAVLHDERGGTAMEHRQLRLQ